MMKLADMMLGPPDKILEHTLPFRQLWQTLSVELSKSYASLRYVALLATPKSRLSTQEFSISDLMKTICFDKTDGQKSKFWGGVGGWEARGENHIITGLSACN